MNNDLGVWVAGEALIDFIEVNGEKKPIVGGGAANTAIALARLDVPTSFIGGISKDNFGKLIEVTMRDVDLTLTKRSDLPTAYAEVLLDSAGSASYRFQLENTATFDFRREWLPNDSPRLLHVGTLATLVESGASELFSWASSLKVPIIYDPNVRSSVLNDRDRYRKIVERWAGVSKIVKLSEDDLEWLGYESGREFLDFGTELVVLTRGNKGISGFTKNKSVAVPALAIDVVDSIGAGDTVGAVIAEMFIKLGFDEVLDDLQRVLTRACAAAAITCSRLGANPPSLSELNQQIAQSGSIA